MTSILFVLAENLNHIFNSTKLHFYDEENVTLTCSGSIDFPEISNIYISKDNITVNTTVNNLVTYTIGVSPQKYGMYNCTLNASGMEFSKSLFLRNKGIALKLM